MKNNDLDFRRGYYMAVAEIVRQFDEPTLAYSILRSYGELDFRGIDEADVVVLRRLVKSERVPAP